MNADRILVHLMAQHTREQIEAVHEGRVVYVLAKDGMSLRAGEIFINPIAYKYTLELAALTGDESTAFAIHWLDQTPLQHVTTCPHSVTIGQIVMHSLSPNVIIDRVRRLHAHRRRLAALN